MTLEEKLIAMYQAGVAAVEPGAAVRRFLQVDSQALVVGTGKDRQRYPFSRFRRILVVGAGKAAAPMAQAVIELLEGRVSAGCLAVKSGHGQVPRGLEAIEAGHPVPDSGSIAAANRILELLAEADEATLCIFLISGGGSALLEAPAQSIGGGQAYTLDELRELTGLLLRAGAPIAEINTIRKHLSAVKGGRASAVAAPATTVSLILSDVVADRLDTIASGPTVPDSTTYSDAIGILEARGILGQVPTRIRDHLDAGRRGLVPETLLPDDPVFRSCRNTIIGSNLLALEAAEAEAGRLGLPVLRLSSSVVGEARELAGFYAALAREIVARGRPAAPPIVITAGGEPTVTIRGSGTGGRNQEMALAAIAAFRELPIESHNEVLFLAAATDGNDGPTDAAGGFASPNGAAALPDPASWLADNDSYPYLRDNGLLFAPGPTGTNVCDLHFLAVV